VALLTDGQIDTVARRGQWYLDMFFGNVVERQDSVVYTGQGAPDLDRIIALMEGTGSYPGFRFLCDVGFTNGDWRRFDLEDLQRLRVNFEALYGNVPRIDAYRERTSTAFRV
jgi:hypothetical protein